MEAEEGKEVDPLSEQERGDAGRLPTHGAVYAWSSHGSQ